jgi:hypothetical protein
MNTQDGYQRRHFSRIPFHAEAQLHFDLAKEEQTAHLLDISLKGALLEMIQPNTNHYEGRVCNMELPLGKDGEHILMEGKVIHQEDRLIGIECQHIDLDSMTSLRRLVELNMGDEPLLERELAEMLKLA